MTDLALVLTLVWLAIVVGLSIRLGRWLSRADRPSITQPDPRDEVWLPESDPRRTPWRVP